MNKSPIDKVLSYIKSEMERKTCMEIAAIAVRMLKEHGYYITYQRMISDHTVFNEDIVSSFVINLQRDLGKQLGWNPLAMMIAMIRRFVCKTRVQYKLNPMMILIVHKYGTEKHTAICDKVGFNFYDEVTLKVKQMKLRKQHEERSTEIH